MLDLKNSQQIFWIITVFISLIVFCSVFFLTGLKSLAFLFSLAVIASTISYNYPRLGLILFLVYLPFAGTLIYSVGAMFVKNGAQITLSGSHYFLFQLAKDFFTFLLFFLVF